MDGNTNTVEYVYIKHKRLNREGSDPDDVAYSRTAAGRHHAD